MLKTTLGNLLIDEALPQDMRGKARVLHKDGVKELLQEVAERYPDQYREVSKKLLDIGRDASFSSGGYSFGPDALRPTKAAQAMRESLQQELDAIYDNDQLDDKTREQAILKTVGKYQAKLVDDVMDEATAAKNPIAMMAKSGMRGNKFNVNSLLGADLLYTDHKGKSIPIPVMRSYSQGLSPVEYFAGAFGARKGVMDLKSATQDAGFLAKQLVQAAHRLVVTADDDDEEYDASNPRGVPVDTDDRDSEGGLLAHAVGGYARNTELTPKILKDLQARGIDRILVRSPLVGGPADGGVYGRDVGRRERGRIAPVGDFVGIAAAQALAEPVTQGQISSKHTGGIAGAAGAGAIAGFKQIDQMIQVPERGSWAAHAQQTGRVTGITEAPQGGHYVHVEGVPHYVRHGQKVTVAKGDSLEAGDVLSDGTENPSEITHHKGIGEGRWAFARAFTKLLNGMGTPAHRRNVELLARGLINHVRLTDEVGDWSPDDIVPYQSLERQWQPRDGHAIVDPSQAVGKYLERPVLHYTVGTKIRPSTLKDLQTFGVSRLTVHNDPPPFQPEMIRGMATVSHDPDFMVRPLGSYQSKSVLEAAQRGGVSDTNSTSYVPALAAGADFGRSGPTQGWKP